MKLDWVVIGRVIITPPLLRRFCIPRTYKERPLTYGESVQVMHEIWEHVGDEGYDPDHMEIETQNGHIIDVYFNGRWF